MMLWFTGRNSLSVQCLILIAIFNHNCNSKISVLNWFPEIGRPISCNCYSFLHLSTTSQETLWWKCSLSRFTTWKKKIKSFNFSMFNLLMVVSSELYENFVYKTKEIEFKNVFSSRRKRGTEKKFWVTMRNRTSDLRIPKKNIFVYFFTELKTYLLS